MRTPAFLTAVVWFTCALNAWSTTFVVTNHLVYGEGSLLDALTQANATPGPDVIQFNIPPGGPVRLSYDNTPPFDITDPVTMNGTTQPGFAGSPLVTLGGEGALPIGLRLLASNCVVRGLAFTGFSGAAIELDSDASGNVLGSTNAGAANVIASNPGAGIRVLSGTNNLIRGNAIFQNGGPGIDLGGEGPTANDSKDPDAGANQLQNFPTLSSVTVASNSVAVSGSLNSQPNTLFVIDLYANAICPPAGASAGQTWLGSTTATTGGTGNATFSVTLPRGAAGRFFTATVTDPQGNTSEFSPCRQAASTIPPLGYTVVNTNDRGPGSL